MRLMHLLLSGLLLAMAQSAYAVNYDVELIIFEHARRTSVGAGDTLLVPIVEKSRNIPQELPQAGLENAFTALPELRLLEEAAKIDASESYRMLYHGGWRQPALTEAEAPWMRIELGPAQQLFMARSNTDDLNFQVAYPSPPYNADSGYTATTSHRLAGALRVWVGRFLHLESQLVFTPTDATRSFRIESNRRMRSRRMHYIDHTRIGIIAKIFPVDESAAN